ncbi:MAG: CUB domain-containing protein, partial [Chitinophagales bacterium]
HHFINNSHTDPGVNWDWSRYYRLINALPTPTLLTNYEGVIHDSGGTTGNYANEERQTWLISPPNASNLTLDFSAWAIEDGWDFLWIYDGNGDEAPLIGQYSGEMPPNIVSSSGSLFLEFRSDCGDNQAGWTANYTSDQNVCLPQTSLVSTQDWYTDDFSANFQDDINCMALIDQRFYQVLQKESAEDNEFRANSSAGFFNDAFAGDQNIHTDWTTISGSWSESPWSLVQAEEDNSNSNIYAPVAQNANTTYLYHWRAKMTGEGDNRRSGIHFFADEGNTENRGNSYFVYFRIDQNKVQVYKVIDNVFNLETDADVSLFPDVWYDYKITFNPETGVVQAFVNDVFAVEWIDSNPHQTGDFISLRTGDCSTAFDFVEVWTTRTDGNPIITVGNMTNAAIQTQGTGISKMRSVVNNDLHHWSPIATSAAFGVDYSPPSETDIFVQFVDFNDNLNLLIDWDLPNEPHSNIVQMQYQIGTTAGGNDLVPLTNNGLLTEASISSINFELGTDYFITLFTENSAGLIGESTLKFQCCTATGIGEDKAQLNTFTLYPNPANDLVHLRLDALNQLAHNSSFTYHIYSLVGQLVKIGHIQHTENRLPSIPIEDLGTGTYLLTLTNPTKQQEWHQPFVVLR